MTRVHDLTRALLALVLLVGFVVGAPILLWSIPATLDLHLPAGGITAALTRPDDGNLLLLALVGIGWVCWAAFTIAVASETLAVLHTLPAPRLPGLAAPQRMAGALIATIALLAPTTGTPSSAPAARPTIDTVAPIAARTPATVGAHGATAATVTASPTDPAQHPTRAAAAGTEAADQVITVHRHDTLWGLAETYLGAGERWPEIYQLNRGHPQPDGRALHDPDWIYPGWQLRLPPQTHHRPQTGTTQHRRATDTQPNHEPVTAATEYQVRPGDTLWQIAAANLGDPTRWRQIYQLNQNRTQPDGGRLSDPALILPGWRLRLPDTSHPSHAVDPPRPQRTVTPTTSMTAPAKGTHPVTAPTPSAPNPAEDSPTASVDRPGLVVPPVGSSDQVPAADGPTAPPATPTPHGTSAEPDSDVIIANDDPATSESDLLPLLGLGLTASTLTGLVIEVRRRRRRQQASRRPGQRIPMPEPDAAAREVTAKIHSIPGTVEVITAALRALAASCRGSGRPLPDVLLIHAAADGVRLTLTEPDPEPLPPFEVIDDRTWLLTQDPATLPTADSDPYPALVSLGVADSAMVLLNLEAVGTLTLTGDPDRVRSALRAFAADLAIGPFSGAATLTLTGPMFQSLADTLDPGRSHPANRDQAARELANHATTLTGLLGDTPLRDTRTAHGLTDTTRPVLLISDQEQAEGPHPWSGATLIHPGAADTSTWWLDLAEAGPAVLAPTGLKLDPQQLGEQDYQAIVDLLATADVEPGHQQPADQTPQTARVRVEEALPDAPRGSGPVQTEEVLPELPPAGEAPRVLLLGPLQVTGVRDDRAPHRTRRLTELIAYLALHPEATASQIDEALWPGKRVTSNTRASFISRTRQWLGHDSDGNLYLPLIGDGGRLTLAKPVTCDWYDFLRHARAGLHGDNPDELAAALDLVRGRPFLGIEDRRYIWAEDDIQQMISTIGDVADRLVTHHAGSGEHRAAMRAALRGLQVDGSAERLLTAGRVAAQACGDEGEAKRLSHHKEQLEDDLAIDGPLTGSE